jgi:hypothetical protein
VTETPLDLEKVAERQKLAYDELIRILSVNEDVRMTIPANPARDTDLLITDSLKDIPLLLAKLEQPCGSCHPCANWPAETWKRAGEALPAVITWQQMQAWKSAAEVVLEKVRVGDRPALEVIEYLSEEHLNGVLDAV